MPGGMEAALLATVAAAFAVVNGVNDGSTLVAIGLKFPSVRRTWAVALLAGAVVAMPLLFGTQVATTLATRLVAFDSRTGRSALFAAIVAAVVVIGLLSWRGLPTSLTVAVVGGIVGSGLGYGLPVAWPTVGLVLALAVITPAAGASAALGLSRLAVGMRVSGSAGRRLRTLHRLAFALQCLAYGANDGQKMLAVFAVAFGASTGRVWLPAGHLASIGALFGVGTLLGVRRFAGTVGGGVLALRPPNAVAAELSAAGCVFGAALLGVPVSMTQAVAGAVVGTGISEGYRRIRWRAAFHIGLAWVVTLPASAALAAALARLIRL